MNDNNTDLVRAPFVLSTKDMGVWVHFSLIVPSDPNVEPLLLGMVLKSALKTQESFDAVIEGFKAVVADNVSLLGTRVAGWEKKKSSEGKAS